MGPSAMECDWPEGKKPQAIAEHGDMFLVSTAVRKYLLERILMIELQRFVILFNSQRVAGECIYSFLLSATAVQEKFHASLQQSQVFWDGSQSMLESDL